MRITTEEIKQLYYTISQVAELLQESTSAIRYWSMFYGIQPKRDSRGHRKFSQDNVKMLRYIRYLLRLRMFTPQGALLELQTTSKNFILDRNMDIIENELKAIIKHMKYAKKNNSTKSSCTPKQAELGC